MPEAPLSSLSRSSIMSLTRDMPCPYELPSNFVDFRPQVSAMEIDIAQRALASWMAMRDPVALNLPPLDTPTTPQTGFFFASLVAIPDVVLNQVPRKTDKCNLAAVLFLSWVARRISLAQSTTLKPSARALANEKWAEHAETLLQLIEAKMLAAFPNLVLALTIDFMETEVGLPASLEPYKEYATRIRTEIDFDKDHSISFPFALRCTPCHPGTRNFRPRLCLSRNVALSKATCDPCHRRNKSNDCVVSPLKMTRDAASVDASRASKRRASSSLGFGSSPAKKHCASASSDERQTVFDDILSYFKQLAWSTSQAASLMKYSSSLFNNLADLYDAELRSIQSPCDDVGDGEYIEIE